MLRSAPLEFVLSTDVGETREAAETVMRGLRAYNYEKTQDADFQPLRIFLRDEKGEIVGGLLADTYWGWLDLGSIWVAEHLREHGYGRQLMARAEAEGVSRGCTQAFLDTFSFQAREFYERLGYVVAGTLDEFPPGHRRFLMRKRLSPSRAGA